MASLPNTTPAPTGELSPDKYVPEAGRFKTHQPTLAESTSLTPAHYERKKTAQQKAEDVIYTLNHAVTCLNVTDLMVLPFVASTVSKITGKIPKWHHDHGSEYGPYNWVKDKITGKETVIPHVHHEGEHHHGTPLSATSSGKEMLGKLWHNSKGWILSEAIGDLGAVPVTVGIQRFFPGFMDTLRHSMEPWIGGMFKRNTMKAAVNWGKAHGKEASSQEVVDYAQELYGYEMRHMPQMAVWTVLSVALNWAAMLTLGKALPHHFPEVEFKDFAVGKAIGATITGGLVLGIRGITPGGAHWWDQHVGKHVILPITKVLGAPFGVKTEDVEHFHKREELLEGKLAHTPGTQVTEATKGPKPELAADWQERVQQSAETPAVAAGIST